MKILLGEDVATALQSIDVLETARNAFVSLGAKRSVQPPQVSALLPDSAGDIIYYPAIIGDMEAIGISVSPFLSALADAGQYPVADWTLVISTRTGRPTLLCDTLPIVVERTGATTALAVDYLASGDASRLAIVGSGPIAQSHLRYVSRVRTWQSIRVYSPTITTAGNAPRREAMSRVAEQIAFTGSQAEALEDADVVLLCTSAESPIMDPRDMRPGTLVTSVTTDGPNAHEIPPEALPSLAVYCDYAPTTPSSAGEMILAATAGIWSPNEVVADLSELAVPGRIERRKTDRVSYFRSIGLGIENLAVAAQLADMDELR